ncbi:MAG: aspartate-semialdehyde dehydrogenase [Candidatus Heimdallarchaeota archaeon]|nr:aspartate-semialdehyde dehydrogenase [Candidatus Heimdallarchaeota archaeon]MDH5644979.1 aspartate-semialdehyde dehydrogenase [Candidatus Heimdallarchaeota archaeon]
MDCGILGASGIIGQQFIAILNEHPKFKVTEMYASQNSAGKSIEDIWSLPNTSVPNNLSDLKIKHINNIDKNLDILFSALPSQESKLIETKFANQGFKIFSNASGNRMEQNIPILIPEINHEHLELLKYQNFDKNGFIITNSNCSTAGLTLYLHELRQLVNFDKVIVSTYQALSGAGKKGLEDKSKLGNVVPFIKNEEEKMKLETKKIMGKIRNNIIIPYDVEIEVSTARVPVVDGHLLSITVIPTDPNEAKSIDIESKLDKVITPFINDNLYFAPNKHLIVNKEEDRPQPKLDINSGTPEGMPISVGRIRNTGSFISAFVLVHNTIRGGAGGSVLNAELSMSRGLL